MLSASLALLWPHTLLGPNPLPGALGTLKKERKGERERLSYPPPRSSFTSIFFPGSSLNMILSRPSIWQVHLLRVILSSKMLIFFSQISSIVNSFLLFPFNYFFTQLFESLAEQPGVVTQLNCKPGQTESRDEFVNSISWPQLRLLMKTLANCLQLIRIM